MAIPRLSYAPRSQNQRVEGFEVPGDEQLQVFSAENLSSNLEIELVIRAAYQQIFNEQQMLSVNRKRELESQLKNRQITVRDFVRGLLLSDTFRQRNVDVNNNYRLVQMTVQRVLGREVYSEQEKIAWSIVIATKGFQGFVDELLESDEYFASFGLDTVPYQKRRILPQQSQGDLPTARMPRYGNDHRDRLIAQGYFSNKPLEEAPWVAPAWVTLVGKTIVFSGAAALIALTVATALAAFELISL
ncbi:phycobilisome rod-core linker polypeptide [[Limnothrix rosea] IAM M-220]|uniref:phycobilisome rod-core linker polypeptide n=1 Tax=[Limnothrix rosea] IAM M-220 TaxID=454133 RepID=UPI00095F8CC7|nr:phycobilisome rod-core linker polypeptide [[Limnothrix rosea] IAM M-220]OKH19768.1 phycobilisome rod-core linker polypeptide CpcG [[Limnothrix rosea] IAM M-220]